MRSRGHPDLQTRTERWFVRRGLPHFIHHYNAREDIFTRAAPVLAVVFVASIVNIRIDEDVRWWENVRSLAIGLVFGLGGIVLVNAVRRRPLRSRPRRIGTPELVAFVVVPALAQTVEADVGNGLLTGLIDLIVLAVIYVVTSYGLVPMTRWAIVQTVRLFSEVVSLFARSLPLLLLITMFMFFNAELWRIVDDLPATFLWTSIAVMVLVGTLFIVLRLPRERRALERFDDWATVHELSSRSPLGELPVPDLPDPPAVAPLGRRARANVGLVMFFSQAVQVLLVTATVFAFYVGFGMFTVSLETIRLWTGNVEVEVLGRFDYFGDPVIVTGELIRASLFVAAVAGLQFTVSALVDTTYRDEFFRGLASELRESLAVRALYLASVIGAFAPAVPGDPGDRSAPAVAEAPES